MALRTQIFVERKEEATAKAKKAALEKFRAKAADLSARGAD